MFLIDTNIFLELLLDQERAEEVRNFFERVNPSALFITDFTIYSIGIILTKLQKSDSLKVFLTKVIIESGINNISIDDNELIKMIDDEECKELDFDDSYQYYAAKMLNATIISFDKDFDSTKLGRKTPGEILAK